MRKRATEHRLRGQLTRALTRPPFRDEFGQKGWFEKISGSTCVRIQPARMRQLLPTCRIRVHVNGIWSNLKSRRWAIIPP